MAIANEDGRRTGEYVRTHQEQAEIKEKDLQYEIETLKQSRAAGLHELESAVSAIQDREADLEYAGKRIQELEVYVSNMRREIQMRDEKLDQRHQEIETWTAECDRLRRQLEEVRQRSLQTSTDHDRRMKEEKLSQQDLQARLASLEVDKVFEFVRR